MTKKNDLINRIIEIKAANYKYDSKEYQLITEFIDIILHDKEILEIDF